MDQLLTGRADEGLAEFLRYENVAWYQDGAVRILDRRKYPTETTYVSCTSVEEVRDAIHDMVTQSGGVKIAAFQALRLHAHQAGGKPHKRHQREHRRAAGNPAQAALPLRAAL